MVHIGFYGQANNAVEQGKNQHACTANHPKSLWTGVYAVRHFKDFEAAHYQGDKAENDTALKKRVVYFIEKSGVLLWIFHFYSFFE